MTRDYLVNLVLNLLCGVLIYTLHGFIKAVISEILGDPTPKKNGRLTLNPIVHIEPIGLIMMLGWGFGWGEPVDTSPVYYKDRKQGAIIVNTVPFIIIFLLGVLSIPFGKLVRNPYISLFISSFGYLSIRNAIFNLIPVYPLDGYKVVSSLVSPQSSLRMSMNEKIYQVLLLLAIFWGYVGRIIDPIFILIYNLVR